MNVISRYLISTLFMFSLAGCYTYPHMNIVSSNAPPLIHRIGIPADQAITLPPFSIVDTTGFYNVEIRTRQLQHQVELIGDQAVIARIVVTNKNGKLLLRMQEGFRYTETGPVLIKISMDKLRLLRYSGTGNVTIHNEFPNSIAIQAHGTGEINLNGMFNLASLAVAGTTQVKGMWIDSHNLKIQAGDQSYVYLAGVTSNLDVLLSNNARLDAKYLRARKAFINTVQNSTAEVHVYDSLNTLASGSSNIYYYITPHFIAPYNREKGSVMSMVNIPPK